MNPGKLVESFSPIEQRGIADALPDSVFLEAAAARGFVPPEIAGSLAVAASLTAEVDTAPVSLEAKLGEIIESDSVISAREQLNTMTEFWQRLGLSVPELDEHQWLRLQQTVENNPRSKVLPVPLLTLAGWRQVSGQAKELLPDNTFAETGDLLSIPNEDTTPGQLLRQPEELAAIGNIKYGLRNYTRGRSLSARADFISNGVDYEDAIKDTGGTAWIFPVMDLSIESPRVEIRYNTTLSSTAHAIHRAADFTQTLDALIAMQLIHLSAGKPNRHSDIDISSEGIYEISPDGNAIGPVSVLGVYWNDQDRQIAIQVLDSEYLDSRFGARQAESGL
jgi:hypothetical protein